MNAKVTNYRDRLMSSSSVWNDLMKRKKPLVQNTIIDGGAAGLLTVTGILFGDELVSVLNLTDNDDITSEFKFNDTFDGLNAQDGKINNAGGSATTGDKLLVSWLAWMG